jgi:hypothetical protein
MLKFGDYALRQTESATAGWVMKFIVIPLPTALLLIFYERIRTRVAAAFEVLLIKRRKKLSTVDKDDARSCSFYHCGKPVSIIIEEGKKVKPLCDLHFVESLLGDPLLQTELLASAAKRTAEPALPTSVETNGPPPESFQFWWLVGAIVSALLIYSAICGALWEFVLSGCFGHR